MNPLKKNILQKSVRQVPAVIILKNGRPVVQKMARDKWENLSEERRSKIKNYAKKRNESVLQEIEATSYLESINNLLDEEKPDTSALSESLTFGRASETLRSPPGELRVGPPTKVLRPDAVLSTPTSGGIEPGREDSPGEPRHTTSSARLGESKGMGEIGEKEEDGDIDLTPNFVNTFFSYVNDLVKNFEVPKTGAPPEEEKKNVPIEEEVKKPIILPDYSDPNACNTTPLPPGWTEHVSSTTRPGVTYYYNEKTGESVWVRPQAETTTEVTPGEKQEGKTDEQEGKTDEQKGKEEGIEKRSEPVTDPGKDGVDTSTQSLPKGWTRHMSQSSDPGKEYYYNESTGETRWERPPHTTDLSAKWTRHVSQSSDPGKEYYYNESTGETRWERPPDFKDTETNNTHTLKCHNCLQEGGLNLFSYIIDGDGKGTASKVRFCCFKCFEKKEFPMD